MTRRLRKAKLRLSYFLSIISLILIATPAFSSAASPSDFGLTPIKVTATDTDNDAGGSITVNWIDPGFEKLEGFTGYLVFRKEAGKDNLDSVAFAIPGTTTQVDEQLSDSKSYTYFVSAVVKDSQVMSEASNAVTPSAQWFDKKLAPVVVMGIIICGSVIFFIETAKRGKKLFLRRIAGLEAIDEAVGRATEMGRSILFVPGIQDMDDVQTIAALTILGRIAKTVAEYDTKISMPSRSSLVMTAGREIIRDAYSVAGRPDAYNDDIVYYVTDEQFGYVAAINGVMVRDKPATCFYLGAFFAESLILAETGNSIDAIQIAGTAQPAQLPFFVAACDYTLIGEELFAASAYLSGEPRQLGSLKGQDVGKAVAIVLIIVGTFVVTVGRAWNFSSLIWVEDILRKFFANG